MEAPTANGATITFTPVFKDRFLFVQRHVNDDVLPGLWCFPGGKVEVGETVADTIRRECAEEVGIELTGRAFFVDSYLLGSRFGLHFAVEASSDGVALGDDLQDFRWVSATADLAEYSPRIPGIDNHLHYTTQHLARFENPDLAWTSLDQYDLVKHRFLNR
jgi:mutator protein MutT